MLPEITLKWYRRVVVFSSRINLFPYTLTWNKDHSQFAVSRSTLQRVKYGAQIVLLGLYQLFLLSRARELLKDRKLSFGQRFQLLYMISAFLGFSPNITNTWQHADTFPLLINSFLEVTRTFGQFLGRTMRNGKKKDIRNIAFAVIPAMLLVLSNTVGAFKRPESPLYLTSLLPEPRRLGKGALVASAFFHGYLNLVQYFLPIFNMVTVICYVDAVVPMMEGLRFQRNNGGGLVRRSEQDTMHAYQELCVMQKLFNSCYGKWAFAAENYYILFSIANVFKAVVLSNPRAVFAGLFLITLAIIVFKHMALIYECSSQTLGSWKNNTGASRWFRKFLRACRPVRVKMGSLYYVDYKMVLTMISIIFCNSVTMIITYKDV